MRIRADPDPKHCLNAVTPNVYKYSFASKPSIFHLTVFVFILRKRSVNCHPKVYNVKNPITGTEDSLKLRHHVSLAYHISCRWLSHENKAQN